MDTSPATQLSFPPDLTGESILAAPDDSPAFSGCTGEHRAHVLKVRAQVVELTAAGVGVRRIAEALSIAPQTVRAIRALAWRTGKLDHEKQRLGRDYLAVADLLRAEALERIEDIPPQVLLLASAQAADKGQLLTGGATERVERTARTVDLAALIADLPAAAPVIEGEIAPHKEPDAQADREDLEASGSGKTDSPSDEDHA